MSAANRYTTTELLTSMRRKGHIPPSQTPFADADLLALADDEILTSIMSQIKSVRENFYVAPYDTAVNTSSVYNIPTRAVGAGLIDLWIVNGTSIYQVGRTELNQQFSSVSSPTGYWGYYLQANQIVIRPANVSGLIRQWIMMRPNTMVLPSAAAQVTAVDLTTNKLSFASIPTTFQSAIQYDCIMDQPHFGWNFVDQTGTVNGLDITFASLPLAADGTSAVQVGDWLALAGQTPIPQVIVEFRPLLVQRVVVKYYEIQGYLEKMKAAQEKLKEMEKAVFELINPRVADEPKRIVPDSNVIGGYRRWRAWRAT
jgi:hypothetical protein